MLCQSKSGGLAALLGRNRKQNLSGASIACQRRQAQARRSHLEPYQRKNQVQLRTDQLVARSPTTFPNLGRHALTPSRFEGLGSRQRTILARHTLVFSSPAFCIALALVKAAAC